MMTRFNKKRKRYSGDNWHVIENPVKKSRKRSSNNKNDGNKSDLRIILQKVSPRRYMSCRILDDSEWQESRQKPLFIPQLDFTKLVHFNRSIENSVPPSKLNCFISKKENELTSCYQFTSMRRTPLNNDVQGCETITTSNILSVRTESMYIPLEKYSDAIIGKTNNIELNEVHPKNRILQDVKNIIHSNDKYKKMRKKADSNISSTRGRENVHSKLKVQDRMKKENSHHETPFRKISNENILRPVNVIVNLERIVPKRPRPSYHHHFVEEEFLETSSRTKKQSSNSVTEIRKKVKIRKTRGVAVHSNESGVHQNKTEIIRKYCVEKVKSISLPIQVTPPSGRITRNKKKILDDLKDIVSKNLTVTIRKTPKVCLIPYECISEEVQKPKKKKKNLNVSFKKGTEISEEIPTRFTSKRVNSKSSRIITSTPCLFNKDENIESEDIKNVFLGFAESVNLSSNNESCFDDSNPAEASSAKKTKTLMTKAKVAVLKSVDWSSNNEFYSDDSDSVKAPSLKKTKKLVAKRKAALSKSVDLSSANKIYSNSNSVKASSTKKSKKRMTKAEAVKKTESCNQFKKTLESNLPIKISQRLALKKMKEKLNSQVVNETGRYNLRKLNSSVRSALTPYVRLNKLSEADISSYKITPLREDRYPLKSKTEDDYGIDDVNTDDSTDDEDCPKKVVPQWANDIRENRKKSFNPQEMISRKVIQKWMQPPKFKGSLKNFLFKKK